MTMYAENVTRKIKKIMLQNQTGIIIGHLKNWRDLIMVGKKQNRSKPRKKRVTKRPLDLAKLIRKHAYVTKGKQKRHLKVSAESEKEIISRIIIAIEDNMPLIAQIAHNAGRNTIKSGTIKGEMYNDVVSHFGKRTSKAINGEEDA